ncbi:endonuclease/exonuclease/phosphatase family protein [Talaromyces stipitatus ATCC 10500]|uniref:Endonuclease/exonuclease/phosphatase family protein n=1 Tax=Talaromyces stipitatus (strain ATCC 10500 / CBS 375.48 / QM 6759 / NRRL 1006) TaxID=441959 RepID=B8MR71_TALSN|nr:endonuclease/exonuclease/phosphatase family protein [Talaromyces stipitatus ATCC 10500]EED12966.1 endonuclease/exonuclease/phosphatase family protein [Talaromyces stipitatus ATCC 10500]
MKDSACKADLPSVSIFLDFPVEMSLFSRFRTRVLGWWHDVPFPLPALEVNASPVFQSWHRFDSFSNRWIPFNPPHETTQEESSASVDVGPAQGSRLVLVTWNVDATASGSETRISAIISHLQNSVPLVDVIFLQEVSRPALTTLLAIPWLRDHWYSSEADTINWGTQSFANMTLVSRLRLDDVGRAANNAALGPIWRAKYPSRFERDALCCDILLTSSRCLSRVRLINVHLDSLPIQPSLRPIQLSVVASYLHAAGRGIVAGDFNSVLPEDDTLVSTNCLVDVWAELHPDEAALLRDLTETSHLRPTDSTRWLWLG